MKVLNPYTDLAGGHWLRGNLHSHSTRSDGSRSPQVVLDDYARRGYDFLMLSDHDILSAPQDYAQWDSKGMLLINGNEVSANGVHVLHVDADRRIEPHKRRQVVLDEINRSRGFAIVAHPNWTSNFDHCPLSLLLEWQGYLGMEIFNGLVQSHPGSAYSLDKWDLVLSDGRKVWGFANDDSHRGVIDIELGWNVVYAREKSVKGILEAMREGRFYPSTGVTIQDVKVDGANITITTKDAVRIAALMDYGKRFATVEGTTMTVTVPAGASYVRFECFGTGERYAWTQPFFIDRTEELAELAKSQVKNFIKTWDVTPMQQGLKLADAQLRQPGDATGGGLEWTRITSEAAGRAEGFVDVRSRIEKGVGVIYLSTTFQSDKAHTGRVYLGFDGPVRAWLNGKMIYQGPGTNPAIIDRIPLYADFKQGENRLTVALDNNNGKAWGIYARVETDA